MVDTIVTMAVLSRNSKTMIPAIRKLDPISVSNKKRTKNVIPMPNNMYLTILNLHIAANKVAQKRESRKKNKNAVLKRGYP